MALDDVVDAEVAIVAAATAVLVSAPVRALVRRGLIAGVAGVLTAADLVRAAVPVIGPALPRPRVGAAPGLEDITDQPRPEAGSAHSGTPGTIAGPAD